MSVADQSESKGEQTNWYCYSFKAYDKKNQIDAEGANCFMNLLSRSMEYDT